MIRWSKLILPSLVIFVFVLTACSSSTSELTDDFSDPASGWGAASHETYVRGYQQGEYLIQIDVPNWFVWATAGRSYEDAEIKAELRYAGQPDNHFGVICRYNEESFYYFAISSDGYYGIFKHNANGDMEPLTGNDMLYSPHIRQEGTGNQIRALCQGEKLALFINGQLLADVTDSDLDVGDVGLAAGTLSKGGTSIWFDDYMVRNP